MAKKKNKIVVRPWCWYCEREFEDEKVLMQHQKAKHFKCNQCPRRLNTAGGLAVHIQQVHKLDPDQLPRIENALPGRDGYEVEIFGMEGIPAPDVADYKRRKEHELGLPAGSISGSGKGGRPEGKRPRVENRVLGEEELRAQLRAHRALMGGGDPPAEGGAGTEGQGGGGHGGAVYNAAPQTYATPAAPFPPPPGFPGQPPFPPFPPGAGFPPGAPPPGFPFAPPPPGLLRPPGAPMPPFPPFPPGASASPPVPGQTPPFATPFPPGSATPPFPGVPPQPPAMQSPNAAQPPPSAPPATPAPVLPPRVRTPLPPNPPQTNPALKAGTVLVWQDANVSPHEKRAQDVKYRYIPQGDEPPAVKVYGPRGTKRARAEDYL